jgi:hypothetical protein
MMVGDKGCTEVPDEALGMRGSRVIRRSSDMPYTPSKTHTVKITRGKLRSIVRNLNFRNAKSSKDEI